MFPESAINITFRSDVELHIENIKRSLENLNL